MKELLSYLAFAESDIVATIIQLLGTLGIGTVIYLFRHLAGRSRRNGSAPSSKTAYAENGEYAADGENLCLSDEEIEEFVNASSDEEMEEFVNAGSDEEAKEILRRHRASHAYPPQAPASGGAAGGEGMTASDVPASLYPSTDAAAEEAPAASAPMPQPDLDCSTPVAEHVARHLGTLQPTSAAPATPAAPPPPHIRIPLPMLKNRDLLRSTVICNEILRRPRAYDL